MLYENNQRSWRPVQRPVLNSDPSRFISQYKVPTTQPPPVAPKPGRKVYASDYSPDFVQQGIQEPRAKTPKDRVKDRLKRNSRGYKVLADVTPNLRATSKGGKMFIRQRNRMDKFTKETQSTKSNDDDDAIKDIARKKLEMMGVTDTWATPWNMATSSPSTIKYNPANKFENDVKYAPAYSGKRVPLSFMPRPPTHWRAKVEEDYPIYPGAAPMAPKISQPIKVRRIRNNDGYMTEGEGVKRNYTPQPQPTRPDSAPPINDEDSGYENNIYHSTMEEVKAPKVSIPAVTINFNARDNFSTPHRQQGVRQGRGVFTTTPYVMLDFNARPKGWNNSARSYYC